MAQLDAEIRRLESEYNQYFAGRLPRPPWVTKNRVTALVKKWDNTYIQNTADRFRFDTIQTRFYKFLELVERQMANREMGRATFGKRPTQASAPSQSAGPEAPAAAAGSAPESRRSAKESASAKADERVVKFNKAEAGADARVKELYEQLAAAKKQVGEEPVAYERVAALVKAQVSKFADDGTNVAFKIALKDGKVSLTVKPEKGS
ncbi:MAG TPA: MXAN_5187 C-terminal domain-containing protein [Sphingomicrobium sp.]|nr:MXAN_5187 C-terminal domain-containing protein [Sphingomicrobium sp.]